MALVRVANGDLTDAGQVDQFVDLLTGVMTDQPVHIANAMTADGGLLANPGTAGIGAGRFAGGVNDTLPTAGVGPRDLVIDELGAAYVRRTDGKWLGVGAGNKWVVLSLASAFSMGTGSRWLGPHTRVLGPAGMFDGFAQAVAPADGVYLVSYSQLIANLSGAGNAAEVRAHLYINGADYGLGHGIALHPGTGGWIQLQRTLVVPLHSGDTIGVVLELSTAGRSIQAWADNRYSQLSIAYLGGNI